MSYKIETDMNDNFVATVQTPQGNITEKFQDYTKAQIWAKNILNTFVNVDTRPEMVKLEEHLSNKIARVIEKEEQKNNKIEEYKAQIESEKEMLENAPQEIDGIPTFSAMMNQIDNKNKVQSFHNDVSNETQHLVKTTNENKIEHLIEFEGKYVVAMELDSKTIYNGELLTLCIDNKVVEVAVLSKNNPLLKSINNAMDYLNNGEEVILFNEQSKQIKKGLLDGICKQNGKIVYLSDGIIWDAIYK